MNKIIYVDMDNVFVGFKTGIAKLSMEDLEKYGERFPDWNAVINYLF